MVPRQKLRCGIIGAGEFAETCHVSGLQSHPQTKVVAICGPRYEHTRAIANRLGIPDVHTDYKELCSRNDIDAVTVATPNAFHAEHALAALRHDKHVFCEKPLAMNVAEARSMVSAAEKSRKIHQVGFTFRYGYGVRELRRRLKAGDIGRPHYLRVQYDSWVGMQADWKIGWRENRILAGGGMLFDLGSHLFDIARCVLGPIEAVTGFVQNTPRLRIHSRTGEMTAVDTDDIAAAWFRHQNGARGQWFVSRMTPAFTENGCLEVIGDEGALKACLSRGKLDSVKISCPSAPDWRELPLPEEAHDGKPHCLEIMMHSFVNACIRGSLDSEVDASFYDGLAAQEAIAAVIEANENMAWVPLSSCRLPRGAGTKDL